ncbi:MAG: ABZJ_00895 family protein [Desulfobulbus sp.]|nr:ABZJ_00895 family protein [Desulfobulbus sp.]
MTLKGVFLRFFLLYVALLIVAGLIVHYWGLASGSGLNMGALAGSVFGACFDFGRKNGRYFFRDEKWRSVLGFAGIDVALQLFSAAAALSSAPAETGAGAVAFAVGLVGALHALAIYRRGGGENARQARDQRALTGRSPLCRRAAVCPLRN